MRSVFLSYSFANEQDPLLKAVRSIIDAVGFQVVDGKILDTNHVGPGVTNKLRDCYGVVCVLTKEANDSGWVNAEFWQAVGANIKVCFLFDGSLTLGNAFQGRVKFPFSEGNELSAIDSLAGTLGVWKQEAGHATRVLVLPSEIGEEAIRNNAKCTYRCMDDRSAEESDWQEAKLVTYVSGVQARLPIVPENNYVKIKLEYQQKIKESAYTPQQISLELK